MRAVLIDPTDRVIDQRRRLGIDKQDECWSGECRRDDGEMTQVETEAGAARSSVLDATFTTVAGPLVRIDWDDGSTQI